MTAQRRARPKLPATRTTVWRADDLHRYVDTSDHPSNYRTPDILSANQSGGACPHPVGPRASAR
jgi:hypothetical protein